jgi:hypothetical protein
MITALPGHYVSYPGGIGDFVLSKAFVLAVGKPGILSQMVKWLGHKAHCATCIYHQVTECRFRYTVM